VLGKPQVAPEDYDPTDKIDDALYNWEVVSDAMFNNLPAFEHMVQQRELNKTMSDYYIEEVRR
jgi:hypothetical protein